MFELLIGEAKVMVNIGFEGDFFGKFICVFITIDYYIGEHSKEEGL